MSEVGWHNFESRRKENAPLLPWSADPTPDHASLLLPLLLLMGLVKPSRW